MAQKYIPDNIWAMVEKRTKEVNKVLKKNLTEGEVLKYLIFKGLKDMDQDEWKELEEEGFFE